MPGAFAKKRILKYGVMFAAVLIVTVFIFGNSLAGYDLSHNTSDSVSEIILPDKYAESEAALLIIRKTAHLVEYAVLGCAVMFAALTLCDDFGKKFFETAMFYVLAVAVTDEHIQSFSDRTSSTSDIILDFCGALVGFFIGWIVLKAYSALKRCHRKKNS